MGLVLSPWEIVKPALGLREVVRPARGFQVPFEGSLQGLTGPLGPRPETMLAVRLGSRSGVKGDL